jgi:hypothetical protein
VKNGRSYKGEEKVLHGGVGKNGDAMREEEEEPLFIASVVPAVLVST